ncbi:MAG: VOC family protein [Bacteroidia bacterium]
MERSAFIKTLAGASIFMAMDGFSSLVNAIAAQGVGKADSPEFARFGAIHLNNTSLDRATEFWTNVAGLHLRRSGSQVAEFGTESQTLVVVHATAQKSFQEGYSGLYHFAIHAPDKHAFAAMVHRLIAHNYPFSPIDHTMTQSVYLTDPDGITVEFALETPERFKRVLTQGGLRMEGSDGIVRAASAPLDVDAVLKDRLTPGLNAPVAEGARIGHIHLYAQDVPQSDAFYKKMGFKEFNYLPQYLYADVGAGGVYQHRVAMNSWHGINRPLAPQEHAGMRHFQIIIDSPEALTQALAHVPQHETRDGGHWMHDPTGNLLYVTQG